MKKFSLAAAVLIIAAVAVAVLFMMNKDSKPSSFEISNGSLVIGGSFGTTVPLTEITELQITDSMPAVVSKTNGAWLGNNCKGAFIVDNDVKARLYADTSKPPLITFKQGGTVFFINSDTSADTQALYERIKSNIK